MKKQNDKKATAATDKAATDKAAAAERAKDPKASVKNEKTLKAYSADDDIYIADYKGGSLKRLCETLRRAGYVRLPKMYAFCASTPLRDKSGQRVIIEGRYSIGMLVPVAGQKNKFIKTSAARFFAQFGYKVSTGGKTRKAAEERIDELVAAFDESQMSFIPPTATVAAANGK